MDKVLEKAFDYIIEYCDMCSVCARVSESKYDGACGYDADGDSPEGVEPCPMRRERGNVACREGMYEYFLAKAKQEEMND